MSFFQKIPVRSNLKFAYLLEIAGLPYRYYGGAAPDAEEIPGLETNYTDLPAITSDVVSNYFQRINPLESIPETDTVTVSLKPQIKAKRTDGDPIVEFLRKSHPSQTFLAQLTESVGIEPASEGNPIYLKIDRNLPGFNPALGAIVYIHQEAFLVNQLLGDSADPQDDNPFRLRAIARGATHSNGLMRTAIRPHTVSPLIREYPDIQYGGCANWRTRHARLRIALLDKNGNRIGEKNKTGPNSDYVDFIAGFIDVSPRQLSANGNITVSLKPYVAKVGSKTNFGVGLTTLTTGEHYFHQYENGDGDLIAPATHIIGGLMINRYAQTSTNGRADFSFNTAVDYGPGLDPFDASGRANSEGQTDLYTYQDPEPVFGNLLDPSLDRFHPRRARVVIPGLGIYFYDDFDVVVADAGDVGFGLEPDLPLARTITGTAANGRLPILFPGGLEWKVSREIESAMLELVDEEGGLPSTTLPWPQSYIISDADDHLGDFGGWLRARLDAEQGRFVIQPTNNTEEAILASAPHSSLPNAPAEAPMLGDFPRGGKVNTPSFVWSPKFFIDQIKDHDRHFSVGGYYSDRDNVVHILYKDPQEELGPYQHLHVPFWPYSDEDDDGNLFASNPAANRFLRTESEGEGSYGGFPRDQLIINKVGWAMPLKDLGTTEWPCHVAKGFYQRGEKYILVDNAVIPDETNRITIKAYVPDSIDTRSGDILTLKEVVYTADISSVQAVTGQGGTTKYLIELAEPESVASFCDWSSLPDEIWERSGLTKRPVVISVGAMDRQLISDYIYGLLTSPNSLGIPTDYVDRGALDLLQARSVGALREAIWSIPAYAGQKTIRELIQAQLQIYKVALGTVTSSVDGKQRVTIKAADYQVRTPALTSITDADMLIDPAPFTVMDDRNLNQVTIDYTFDFKGTANPDRKGIVRSRLGEEEYDEVRGISLELHGLADDLMPSELSEIRDALVESAQDFLSTWRNSRLAWRFSTKLQAGMRSLLGETILITSNFLEQLGGYDQGVLLQAGIVLEQNIDLMNASVSFLVVQYPEANLSGWNAAVMGRGRKKVEPASGIDTRLYVDPDAFSAISSQFGTEESRLDPLIFDSEDTVTVYVYPVHKPDEGVETTVLSVGTFTDDDVGMTVYYEMTFNNDILHPDDEDGKCVYIVEPLDYDSSWAAVQLLAWFADAANSVGTEGFDALTYS